MNKRIEREREKLMLIFLANKASTHARYVYDEYLLITLISPQTVFSPQLASVTGRFLFRLSRRATEGEKV
jgi:hypothetical protein